MDHFFYVWFRISSSITIRYFLIAGITFLLFYILFKRYVAFRRVQVTFPKITDYRRDIIYSLITVVIFATVAVVVLFALFPYTNMWRGDPWKYGKAYYFFGFVWMFFLHDAYFYWMHRIMHHPKLFKAVHLIHHKSTNPSPWTSYAFHPLEAVFEAGIIPLIAFTLPVHNKAFGLFMLFQFSYNVYGHLGYELYPKGFHKTWIGRWINTSVCHNLHHKRFHGNYGLYTLIWDRLFGTLREEYDQVFEETTSRPFHPQLLQQKD